MSGVDEELREILRAKLASMIREATTCCRTEVPPGYDVLEGSELREILKSCKVVVAFFYTTTCPYCKAFTPIFLEVAEAYSDKTAFVRVNLERHPYMSDAFAILGTPTVIVFVRGKEAQRVVGLIDASRFEAVVVDALRRAGCPVDSAGAF